MKKIILLAAGAALTSMFVFGPNTAAFAASNQHIKLEGIEGESEGATHKGEIDVLSWSWGEASSTRSVGERVMQPKYGAGGKFTITKHPDSSSATLMEWNNTKHKIPSMTVVLPNRDGSGSTEYKLKDVMVTSFKSWSTSGDADDRPTEEVAFYYNKISYKESDMDFTSRAVRKKKK